MVFNMASANPNGGGGTDGLLVTILSDQVPPCLDKTLGEIMDAVLAGRGFVYMRNNVYYNTWKIMDNMDSEGYIDIFFDQLSTMYPHSFQATALTDYPTYRTSGGDN